ncbi:PREDICTED: zinc finger Y-chromosomal protein-like [Priapulus caudatus]|uniref:Zinc finger Y-chromosomal protein-like n=1 Tax=Priapulus caudatus TaxID=37621 RepID=A0ABM1DZ03_PRICU|nr:PREDICTED: zinc finger Y-chromosomal protein-like [Priapulus caudatus]
MYHVKPTPERQTVKYECCDCGAQLTRHENLKRHLIKVHHIAVSKQVAEKLAFCREVVVKKAAIDAPTFESEVAARPVPNMLPGGTITNQGAEQNPLEYGNNAKPIAISSSATVRKDAQSMAAERSCLICGMAFMKKVRLYEHIKNAHKGQVLKQVCCQCGAELSKRDHLKRHIVLVHCITDLNQVADMMAASRVTVKEDTGTDSRSLSNTAVKKKRVRPESQNLCNICQQMFANRHELKDHRLAVHSGNKPKHVCCDCGAHLSRSDHLKRHLVRVHHITASKEIAEKMASCTVEAPRTSVLGEAEASACSSGNDPTLVKPMGTPDKICLICKESFPTGKYLDGHMGAAHRHQTIEHVCCDCGAQFNMQGHLRRHLIDVHCVTDSTVLLQKLATCTFVVVAKKPDQFYGGERPVYTCGSRNEGYGAACNNSDTGDDPSSSDTEIY